MIMKGNCIEIGTIHAFLDGELPDNERSAVSGHLAICGECSARFAVAEEEYMLTANAFAADFDAMVPTQRLWIRINDSIAEERSRVPLWRRCFPGLFSELFSSPLPAAAFGAVVIGIVSLSLMILSGGGQLNTGDISVKQVQSNVTPNIIETAAADTSKGVTKIEAPIEPNAITPEIVMPTKAIRAASDNAPARERRTRVQPSRAVYRYIPGEEAYIKVIADLSRSYNRDRDNVFTPSGRVAFERDLAMIDHAINNVRRMVRNNPDDAAARKMLYSAYQDKIDLLNSAGQKAEVMAAVY